MWWAAGWAIESGYALKSTIVSPWSSDVLSFACVSFHPRGIKIKALELWKVCELNQQFSRFILAKYFSLPHGLDENRRRRREASDLNAMCFGTFTQPFALFVSTPSVIQKWERVVSSQYQRSVNSTERQWRQRMLMWEGEEYYVQFMSFERINYSRDDDYLFDINGWC